MIKYILAAAFALLSTPAFAQDYQAVTNSNAIVRQAPGPDYAQIGTIPSGAAVAVEVCFERGAFCLVDGPAKGFVSGDLLNVVATGQTVRATEASKWAAIDARKAAGSLPDYDARNIVVWGDSLSTNTFGDELAALLGRQVSMQGVPGEDGAKIAARRLATTQFDKRITVIWDRHYTGEDPSRYIADLKPIFDKLADDRYVVISDIRSQGSDLDVEQDRLITDEINSRLRSAHTNNFLDLTADLEDPALRRDGLHLLQAGDEIIARRLADFIAAKGW